VLTLPHTGGGRSRKPNNHAVRPLRWRLDGEGLAASSRWASKLRAGVVWAETRTNKFDPASPFGGFKESGFSAARGGLHGLSPYVVLS